MWPLELEIHHQMRNVILRFVSKYIFTVIDRYVVLFSLDCFVGVFRRLPRILSLVASSTDDSRIIGIYGETKPTKKDHGGTVIQLYEYYISHQLSKSFRPFFFQIRHLPTRLIRAAESRSTVFL